MNYQMTILSNQNIADNTYEMKLEGTGIKESRPGQFINIKLEGYYLRRPISISHQDADIITIVYKVAGNGTFDMSKYEEGKVLDILTPLGNGYDISKSGKQPLIIGGGAGVSPMFGLGRALKSVGKEPIAVLGFNTKDEIYYVDKFEAAGIKTVIATADGSCGTKGFVTDCIDGLDFDCFYACGPNPMLQALDKTIDGKIPGWMSFEERMGCGFGACMGCSCKTKNGNKRVCKDGPVFERAEVIW